MPGYTNKPKRKLIIAIDGPAGAGKSTVARMVARKLKFLYIDTGAMYRAVTLKAMRKNINWSHSSKISKVAALVKITFRWQGKRQLVFLDGIDVTKAIRLPEIARYCSAYVANIQAVRRRLVSLQRAMGKNGGVVIEGRDITTVVFPNADKKFYLNANLEIRTLRRQRELGSNIPLNRVLIDLKRRDKEDKNRPGGALRKVPDAMLINTSKDSALQVASKIISYIKES